MKKVFVLAKRLFSVIWHHTAALVAVVLIFSALVVGYRLGKGPPEPEAMSATSQPDSGGEPQMYTCSMHPSVRLPDPEAKCPICFMDLIPVVDSDGGSTTQLVLSAEAAARSAIETSEVVRFFPTAKVRLYGRLTYDETSVARITTYFPGRLDRLFVNYVGVPVAKGDHLAEVYSAELLAAFEELRVQRLAVDGMTSTSKIVRDAADGTLKAARERLRLFGLTEQQVVDAEAGRLRTDRLTVYSPIHGIVTHLAAREGDYVETGAPIATVADLSRLWLDLEAYESQLPLLRWGQPVTFTVEAHPGKTLEGRVSFIEPIVNEQTRTAAVRVSVDSTARQLKPGMFATATVRVRVASDGAVVSDELAGRWVSPMHPTIVKDEPGTCDVCGMDLVPAESLGVVGDAGSVTEPLVIPRTAALLTGKRAIVYVQDMSAEKPTYEAREIVLGPRAGEFYIVQSGLSVGEHVVTNGAFRIDSAMQIVAKPSMMLPQGGGGGISHRRGDQAQNSRETAAEQLPEAFLQSLKPVYAAYLDGQEALAGDDFDGFIRASADLKVALNAVEHARLVGEPLGSWRRAAPKLAPSESTDSIADARVQFERLSEGIILLQRRFGHFGSDTWNLAYCPMAFKNKGAAWLQRGTEISNPYFGDLMLRCGEIQQAFPPLPTPTHGDAKSSPSSETHEGHDHD